MYKPIRYIAFLVISLLTVSLLYSQPAGITGDVETETGAEIIVDLAAIGLVPDNKNSIREYYVSPWTGCTDDWMLINSQTITLSIPGESEIGWIFDPAGAVFEWIDPTLMLSALQNEAMEKAPLWLREDLYNTFRRISWAPTADNIAQEILDAPDPYVDEVAFCIANSAPMVLEVYMPLPLLLENAQFVYQVDSILDYVEIVDYGDSGDDDYWSTARYRSVDAAGDTIEFEIDKEIYYWYIVHPKLSDEIPYYINPANGQPANPLTGVFWRSWFWTYADSGYMYLNEMFDGVDILWSRAAGGSSGAIGAVNAWIGNVMHWGAGTERPIQPVRIYVLHCGNCGEYQDIRGAAGRTALIPTACTCNICEDHVWNEFWEGIEGEWIHWDGGDINNPLLYENGWGKTLSAVWNYRGDGYIWDVTEKYSAEVCTLNVTVYDSLGKPADGTEVRIRTVPIWGGGYYTTTYSTTNCEGKTTILLGDEKDYFIKVVGPCGSYPVGIGQALVIENGVGGTVYNWEHYLNGYTDNVEASALPDFPNPMDLYKVEVDFAVNYETVYDMYFSFEDFMKKKEGGWVDFFITNEANFASYEAGEDFQAVSIMDHSAGGGAEIVLPTYEKWYGIASTRELSSNRPSVTMTVNVYLNPAAEVNNPQAAAINDYSLQPAYPNPFNNETIVSFNLPAAGRAAIELFNIKGQQIAVLADEVYSAGQYQLKIGGEITGNLASGIYLIKMESGGKQLLGKICLVK